LSNRKKTKAIKRSTTLGAGSKLADPPRPQSPPQSLWLFFLFVTGKKRNKEKKRRKGRGNSSKNQPINYIWKLTNWF